MSEVKNILHKSSKKLCLQAADKAHQSDEFLNDLIGLSIKNEMPFSSRAAWSLLSVAEQNPEKVIPFIKTILDSLDKIENHTQIASLLRMFDALDNDLEECGELFDYCIHILRIPLEREYARAIAMNILVRFGKSYPELIPEISEQISQSLPQFKANHAQRKAKQVLKKLKKMQQVH